MESKTNTQELEVSTEYAHSQMGGMGAIPHAEGVSFRVWQEPSRTAIEQS